MSDLHTSPDSYFCPICAALLLHIEPGEPGDERFTHIESLTCPQCGWTAWQTR
jgi:hypothetical protein